MGIKIRRATDAKSRGKPGCAGRIGVTFFFSVFLGMGLLVTAMMVQQGLQAAATRAWPQVACRIVSSAVEESGDSSSPYRFAVRYEYAMPVPGQAEAAGPVFSSDRYRSGGSATFSDYSEAQRLVSAYPAGAQRFCYVNPHDPNEAILRRGSPWEFLMALFPLIFVAVGGGGIYATWRRPKRPASLGERKDAATVAEAISEKAAQRSGLGARIVLGLFFGVFLAVGLGISIPILILPMARLEAARKWTPTPCRVVSSRVMPHSSDDGTTYSVDILYEYEVEGAAYRSNRYDFLGGSSSGREGKETIVRQYEPGTVHMCYVNPADPHAAVLMRNFGLRYLVGLFPLVFVGVGAVGVWYVVFGRKGRAEKPLRHWQPLAAAAQSRQGSRPPGSAQALRSTASPGLKFFGILLFCLFWNGIVSVFVVQDIRGWLHGESIAGHVVLTVFLLPFLGVGLLLLAMAGTAFLALFNPRPRLHVGAAALAPGGRTQVTWAFTGAVGRLARLRIVLEGREEATYRRGTSTSTDRNVFARVTIVDTTHPAHMESGQATLTVPDDAMHSFEAPNNKIVWRLRVRGEIPKWPDVDEEYAFAVLAPQAAEGGSDAWAR